MHRPYILLSEGTERNHAEPVFTSNVLGVDKTPIQSGINRNGGLSSEKLIPIRRAYPVIQTTTHSRHRAKGREYGHQGITKGVIEVACWAHARRKCFDAVNSYPRDAHQMLEWIRQLYDLEDRARDWPVDARRDVQLSTLNPLRPTAGLQPIPRRSSRTGSKNPEPKRPAPNGVEPIIEPAQNSRPHHHGQAGRLRIRHRTRNHVHPAGKQSCMTGVATGLGATVR